MSDFANRAALLNEIIDMMSRFAWCDVGRADDPRLPEVVRKIFRPDEELEHIFARKGFVAEIRRIAAAARADLRSMS